MNEIMTLQQLIDALNKVREEIGSLDVPVTYEDDCDITEVTVNFTFDSKGGRDVRVRLY